MVELIKEKLDWQGKYLRIGNIISPNRCQKFMQSLSFSILLMALLACANTENNANNANQSQFDGQRAYQDVIAQTAFEERYPGTLGHEQVLAYLSDELIKAGWDVERQTAIIKGKEVYNLIASQDDQYPYILLGAHYDNRMYADQDPEQSLRNSPVPGANDGGSGVAVLLELSRTLPKNLPIPVRLVFFDAEDNGGIGDWDWILGSTAFVRDMEPLPQSAIILDMIGDMDLQVYYERNSDPAIREEIWMAADQLGYGDVFIREERHAMLDDHTPFLQAGIPAVNVIDFDYPYWHTTQDTVDKVSPTSLQVIGDTITAWLLEQQ